MTVLAPQFFQTKGYTAKSDRHLTEAVIDGEGIQGPSDLKPATSGTLTMTVQAGQCTVRGDTNADQGLYLCENDAQVTKTHSAHDATNPRLDQVVMRVYDKTEAGGVNDYADVEIVQGTPTAGATLDNRNGAAALPVSSMPIADVLVPAVSGSITLRDRRPFACDGAVPQTKTVVDMVQFEIPNAMVNGQAGISHANHDTRQSAVLVYLPRRIVAATRIRWRYLQNNTTAVTGNYNIGIYDASGRFMVSTGIVAFTGAVSTNQQRSETITATTFEAGQYYVLMGVDTSAGSCSLFGALMDVALPQVPTGIPNVCLVSSSGGTTLPQTVLSMTDQATQSANNGPAVPMIGLSIG